MSHGAGAPLRGDATKAHGGGRRYEVIEFVIAVIEAEA